jgi:protein-tyrosine kinase
MSLVERALQKMQQAGRPATTADKTIPPAPAREEPARAAAPAKPVQRPTVVARFDHDALRRVGLLPPTTLERRLAGQFQFIKRPIVAAAHANATRAQPDASGMALMVASALPGEGKTFTSLNLAMSLALEKDLEVLLVDADVRKPHVSRLLGVGDQPGLLELLSDSSLHPDSVILDSNVAGLTVLPAGKPVDTATELLSSMRMRELVRQLAPPGGRRVVLFDSPPLLMSTESHALAAHVGQVVLVVRADVTPQKAVLQAIDALGEGKQIGLVLNQSNTAADVNYYGYGTYGDTQHAAERG